MQQGTVELTSLASHGSVTALSELIRVSEEVSVVLVGSLSRVYVCRVGGEARGGAPDARVLLSEEVMPHGMTIHGISVARYSDSEWYHVIAHGGRCVVVMKFAPLSMSLEVRTVSAFQKWVLAVYIPPAEAGTIWKGSLLFFVAMIDNSVEFCHCHGLDRAESTAEIVVGCRLEGDVRCMLYSIGITGRGMAEYEKGCGSRVASVVYDIKVAGGTVLFDVVVWRRHVRVSWGSAAVSCVGVPSKWDVYDSSDIVLGRGHSGSVHCVCWDRDGTRVASGSDDRSVRLWNVPWGIMARKRIGSEGVSTEEISDAFVGHDGRLCSLCFSADGAMLYSGSEDGYVLCWDIGAPLTASKLTNNGCSENLVSRFRAHATKGVRVIGCSGSCLVTGGAEGSVRIWDVNNTPSALRTYIFRGCFDGGLGVEVIEEPSDDLPSVRQLDLQLDLQLLKDSSASFESLKVMHFVFNGEVLLLATDKGRILGFELRDDISQQAAWEVFSAESASSPIVNIKSQRVMGNDSRVYLSCCDARGSLHFISISRTQKVCAPPQLLGLGAGGSRLIDSFFLPCESFGSRGPVDRGGVSSAKSSVICLTSSGELELYDVVDNSSSDGCTVLVFVGASESPLGCRITTVCSFPTDIWGMMIFTGSAKGGLAVWLRKAGGNLILLAWCKGAHSETPVQTIAVSHISGDMLLLETTAMDHCIQLFTLDIPRATLARKNELRVESMKTICERVVLHRELQRGAVGKEWFAGFFSTYFVIWDRYIEFELCRIRCGGWKRPWAFHFDGHRAIFCHTSGVGDVRVTTKILSQDTMPHELMTGSHGREINSVVDVAHGEIITAGADARLYSSSWGSNMSLVSRCFSTQPFGTSTRVLRSRILEGPGRNVLVVSGGARSVVTAWMIMETSPRSAQDHSHGHRIFHFSTFAHPLVTNRDSLMSKSSLKVVDMRVTALELMRPIDPHSACGCAAIALSTGEMELRRIPLATQIHIDRRIHDWPLVSRTLLPNRYPVLSTAHISLKNTSSEFVVWSGNTNGDLISWTFPQDLVEMFPSIHACGVNAMVCLRGSVLVTGGDDQALSVFDIGSRMQSCVIPNAHASAVKDISIVCQDVICSVGLDQYLRVWTLSGDGIIMCIGSKLLQVHEPSSCCCIRGSKDLEYIVTVAGRGIEQLRLHF
jgi:WD40 repeat protein